MATFNVNYGSSSSYSVPNNVRSVTFTLVGGGGGGGRPIFNGTSSGPNGSPGGSSSIGSPFTGGITATGGQGGTNTTGGNGGTGNFQTGSKGVQAIGCFFPEAQGFNGVGAGGAGASQCSSGSIPATFGGGGGGAARFNSPRGSFGAFPNTSYPFTVGQGGVQGGIGNNRFGQPGGAFLNLITWDLPTGTIHVRNNNGGQFGANASIVANGQESATIRWTTTNAETITISPTIGGGGTLPVDNPNGTTVTPTSTTTYTLTAFNPGFPEGRFIGSVTITVLSPPTFNLSIADGFSSQITLGQSTRLRWSGTGTFTGLTWTSGGIQNTQVPSLANVAPTVTTTYSGFLTGPAGNSPSRSVTVTVFATPVVTFTTPTAAGYNQQLTVSFTTRFALAGVSISGTLNYIGSTTNIQTQNFGNATLANLDLNRANVPIPVTWNENGPVSITLTLRAVGGDGTNPDLVVTRTVTIPVTIPRPTISQFVVEPTSIIRGKTTSTLKYSVSGVGITSIVIGPGIGTVTDRTGSIPIAPTSSTAYTIAVTGFAGTTNAQANLTVFQPPQTTLILERNPIVRGESTRLTWQTTGDADTAILSPIIGRTNINSNTTVMPSVTTTYTIAVSGPGGEDSDEATLTVLQPPTINLEGPVKIVYGQQSQIRYVATNAVTSVTLTPTYIYRGQTTTGAPVNLTTGLNVDSTYITTIPYTNIGPFIVSYFVRVVGFGGLTAEDVIDIPIEVDETPDNVIIPSSEEKIKDEQPILTPDERLTSVKIQVNDIDIPVEIKSDKPIEVRFDDQTVWNKIRPI